MAKCVFYITFCHFSIYFFCHPTIYFYLCRRFCLTGINYSNILTNNSMKKLLLLMLTLVMSVSAWAVTGNILFGTPNVKINAASVTAADNLGNSWTITTVGTTSFTQQPTYSQIGSSSKPATSITLTTTLPSSQTITDFSVSLGGFNGTEGDVELTVSDTSVGTGNLNGSADVTVSADTEATGTVLTVTIENIAKGVKIYGVSYSYGSSDPIDATFSFSSTNVELVTGKSAVVTMTTNFDGELIVDSYNTAIATTSYDDATGEITIVGVAPGSTQIGILGDATSNFNEVNEVIEVVVTEPAPFDPSNIVVGDLNWPAAVSGVITLEEGEYTFVADKTESGATAPAYNTTAKDLRIYAKGTFTITNEETSFTQVVFKISTQGKKRLAAITANCGTVAEQALGDETVTWTSNVPVNSVTFTVGDKAVYGSEDSSKAGQLCFDQFSIKEQAYNLTIGETGWASLYLDFSYAAPAGVKFYSVATATAEGVELHEVTTGVKGSLAVLAYAAAGTYRVKATDDYDSNFPNLLQGVTVDTPCAANENYVLGDNGNGTVSFGLYHGTTLKANRAYLPASVVPEGARANLTIDVETGIEQIATDQQLLFGKVYDLQGRELQSLQKGFNIMNGKKVIVK